MTDTAASPSEIASLAAMIAQAEAPPPTEEPISLELAKAQVRVGGTDEDMLIAQSVRAAREWVERYTGHILLRRQVVEVFGPLSGTLALRAWPDVDVTRVEYLAAGGTVTLDPSTYIVSTIRRPAQLALATSGWGQFGRARAGAVTAPIVTVTMTAGYRPGTVPGRMMQAMLILVAAFYASRGETGLDPRVEAAATGLCYFDRRRTL